MKKYAILWLFLGISMSVTAQQDPMYTKYMFNTLSYNPAYAGSSDYMRISLIHRNQWFGLEGSPVTQTLSVHSLTFIEYPSQMGILVLEFKAE